MGDIEKYDEFLAAFEDLRPEYFLPKSFDDEKRKRIAELTTPGRTKTGMIASIPMRCKGPACPFADTCPLQKENIAPIDYPCAIEMAMVAQFTQGYMKQFEVDQENLVEISIIRDLVDEEVQYLRKTKVLAKEDFIQENIIGIDARTGEPLLRKELHVAVELEDRLHKRRQALFKQLLATREAKSKAGAAHIDAAQSMADYVLKLREIENQNNKSLKRRLSEDIIDVDEED